MLLPTQVIQAAGFRDPHRFDEQPEVGKEIPAELVVPKDYARWSSEHFSFIYPRGAEIRLEELTRSAENLRARLVSEIGVDPDGLINVYLARNADDFFKLQPGGTRLPDWVAGVAYPRLNTILLRQAGSQGQAIDLPQTFLHELSHVILRRSVNFVDLPKWFVEGLAQWQARQFDLERGLRLARGLLAGGLIPLDSLMYRFPRGSSKVQLAYDQSFSFINFLVGEFGEARFHELILRLGKRETFVPALESTYAMTTLELEGLWIADIKMNYNWIPLLTSGGTIWTFASVLFIMSYFKRRRQKLIKMAEWEREEEMQDLLISRLTIKEEEKSDSGNGKPKDKGNNGSNYLN